VSTTANVTTRGVRDGGWVGRLAVTNECEPPRLAAEREVLTARVYPTGESAADGTRRGSAAAMAPAVDTACGTDAATPGTQGICEGRETLAGGPDPADGQLVCPECRDL